MNRILSSFVLAFGRTQIPDGQAVRWWRLLMGWMLDAFDVMLYALILTAVIEDLGLSRAQGGLMASLTLGASAVGGLIFGVLADKLGRTRALSLSILLYSVFTFACGLAQNIWQFAIFRVLLGLGMGGEWASGATLVSETWPEQHRGKALGIMQSCWAIGYGLAAIVVAIVLPRFGWRAVFFAGILPALFTLWIRRSVKEPEMWITHRTSDAGASASERREVPAPHRDLPYRDECRDDVRVVGTESLGALVPVAADDARRRRAVDGNHGGVRGRDAGRDVAWLRVVWLHRRRVSAAGRPTSPTC